MHLEHPQLPLPAWISVLVTLGQEFQVTLMEAVPPSPLGVSKQGFKHMLLVFL